MEDQCELVLSPLLPAASYPRRKCQCGELIHIQRWITATESTVYAVLRRIQCCEGSTICGYESKQESAQR